MATRTTYELIRSSLTTAVESVVREILTMPIKAFPFYRVIAEGPTGWAAKPEIRRVVPYDFDPARWSEASESVRRAFHAEAPDHIDNLIGTATGGSSRFTSEDWVRYGVTAVLDGMRDGTPVDVLANLAVDHIVRFVESPRVPIRYLAPLLNFQTEPETVIPF